MASAAVRIGAGTRLMRDGELLEIVEICSGHAGMDVVMTGVAKQTFIRTRLNENIAEPSG